MGKPAINLQEWAVGREKHHQAVLAIGFTDIADSTLLNRKLGDEQMHVVRNAHFTHSHRLCAKHYGYVVKTLGDGLLVVFHAAPLALDFMLALRSHTGHALVTIHTGLHVGPVLIQGNDIFGTAVNYAARLVEEAKKHKALLVSDMVKAHIDADGVSRYPALKWAKHLRKLKGFDRRLVWSVLS